jgi:hypothetical protein
MTETAVTGEMMSAVTTAPDPAITTAIPDLRDKRLDEIAEDGTNVLARSIALYRARLRRNGLPLSSFNAGLPQPDSPRSVEDAPLPVG